MKLVLIYLGLLAVLLVNATYTINASWLAPEPVGQRTFLAHRGVHQQLESSSDITTNCTAPHITPSNHTYLENTLGSIEEAFSHGADRVEIDIFPTSDGEFVLFHDATLDCRTNGSGRVRDHPVSVLKELDIGYGYTNDGGMTFPFRGQGIGEMPTLREVITTFPREQFLFNLKGYDPQDAENLATYLLKISGAPLENYSAYGGNELSLTMLKNILPQINVWSTQSIKRCLQAYMMVGWTGYTPQNCHNTSLIIPANMAKFTWGWPNRFQQRMQKVGTEICLSGPLRKGIEQGVNSVEQYQAVPKAYRGCIWTDRIEVVNDHQEATFAQSMQDPAGG